MSLKRILGTMLATRMGGHGRRRGTMGATGLLGGLGYRRRRRGIGGKMGIAALGYMAYKAYQEHQSSQTSQSGQSRGASRSTSGGSITGMVRDAVDKLTGDSSGKPDDESDLRQDAEAAEKLSDDTALLLIRAMITAAYADGAMSTEERQRIMGEIGKADATQQEREMMEREIANPKSLDELVAQVDDDETAEEFYLASRAAVDGETEPNRAHLAEVRQRLGISDEQAKEIEELAA